MKKSMKALVVLLALAAAATPAFAENRLSLSGEMRVRGWAAQTDEFDGKAQFFDQRLRLGGKVAVAEGVNVNFRIDATEGAWGGDDEYGKDSNRKAYDLQWDIANLSIDKEKFSLVAGQQYFGLGNAIVVDNIGAGLNATIKGQVPVTVFFNRLVEEGGTEGDASLFGINVAHKTDAYSANLFYARVNDPEGEYFTQDGDITWSTPFLAGAPISEAQVNAVGLTYDSQFGAVAFKAEADYIFGDLTALGDEIDVKGLQVYLDGSTKLNDNTKVGLMGFYAQGGDDDKVQLTQLSDWQDWDPTTYGAMNCDFSILPNHSYEVFDFTGMSSGVIGASLYGDFQATKDLLIQASAYYLTPETDEFTDIDATYGGNLSASYALFDNTTLAVQASGSTTTYDDNTDDLNQYVLLSKLAVNF